MDDTSPDIAEKIRELLQMKSPVERFKMGSSMHETSKYLVARAICENNPVFSVADLRQELFLKFYGSDFDPVQRQKILDHLGPTLAKRKTVKLTAEIVDADLCSFEHIPESEKRQEWWRRILPIIQARLSRDKHVDSELLRVLRGLNSFRTWMDVKKIIEIVLDTVTNGERIFARSQEIRKSSDPDGIIDDMFGELRAVPYLLFKGFEKINYSRRDGLDFKAEFGGGVFHIESTYVHGPGFKTQECIISNPGLKDVLPVYRIRPDKLIRLFERIYLNKKKQVERNRGTPHNSLIFMITDLEEAYAPWMEHANIQGVHPILSLILAWEIPVVIFGPGSVYEPLPNSLDGVFGKLQSFDWQNFAKSYLEPL